MWQESNVGLEQKASLKIKTDTVYGMETQEERTWSLTQLGELPTETRLTYVENVGLFHGMTPSEGHPKFGQDFQLAPRNSATLQDVHTTSHPMEQAASSSTNPYISKLRNLSESTESGLSSFSESGCEGTASSEGTSTVTPASGPWRPWALKEEVTEHYPKENSPSHAASPVVEDNQNHANKVNEQSAKVVEEIPPKAIETDSVRRAAKRKKEEEQLRKEVEELRRMMREKHKLKEAFVELLDSLHKKGILTYMSQWEDLYPIISEDHRFSAKFGPHDSTPLDLFHEYVEILKSDVEQKLIRKILREGSFVVQPNTSYKDFARIVFQDRRSASLDEDNVMVAYGSLHKKAKEKNRKRINEVRLLRKLEYEVKDKWLRAEVSVDEPYRNAKKLVEHLESFHFYDRKIGVRKIWKDFINESEDEVSKMFSHHHRRSPESKKKKRY
ncbi:pre-mRNA-processing factor 40 homolog A-like isoform X2 [Drosophila biarmipes]|uniref:pre-mRNA-processing factor 40 homolog A-like isoform X2 n=1 Tax=Drosophila biarmipes TaxID=125945 RepID=UPI0021CCFC75|nr:pre-mRNA-processing factor 40 homolog A-like isoform X2 [Drosophila biarmipes]